MSGEGREQTNRFPHSQSHVYMTNISKFGYSLYGSVQFKPVSNRFMENNKAVNLELDFQSSSRDSLNFGPNLGPVQTGSGSNFGSEPDHSNTIDNHPLSQKLTGLSFVCAMTVLKMSAGIPHLFRMYCTISINSPVTHHAGFQIGEM